MGDWEDIFGSSGMNPDFAPWDSPSWADEYYSDRHNFPSEYDKYKRLYKNIKRKCLRVVKQTKNHKNIRLRFSKKHGLCEMIIIQSNISNSNDIYIYTYIGINDELPSLLLVICLLLNKSRKLNNFVDTHCFHTEGSINFYKINSIDKDILLRASMAN